MEWFYMNELNDDLKHILHSLCYITLIENTSRVANDFDEFLENYSLVYIISFHLIQLSEYTTKLSKNFKENHSEIDFEDINNFRNIVIHNYDTLDYKSVYSVIKEYIPNLKNNYYEILVNEFDLDKDFIQKYINYFLDYRKFNDTLQNK